MGLQNPLRRFESVRDLKIDFMKYLVLLTSVLFYCHSISAQSNKKWLTGIILSEEDSQPLEGAGVWVKGTKNYSGSQPDGIFYIGVEKSDSILVFARDGYVRTEVRLTGETEYSVKLRKVPAQPNNRRSRQK